VNFLLNLFEENGTQVNTSQVDITFDLTNNPSIAGNVVKFLKIWNPSTSQWIQADANCATAFSQSNATYFSARSCRFGQLAVFTQMSSTSTSGTGRATTGGDVIDSASGITASILGVFLIALLL